MSDGCTPVGLVQVQVSWLNNMQIGPPPYEQPRVYEHAIGPAPVYVRPPAYVQPQVSEPLKHMRWCDCEMMLLIRYPCRVI